MIFNVIYNPWPSVEFRTRSLKQAHNLNKKQFKICTYHSDWWRKNFVYAQVYTVGIYIQQMAWYHRWAEEFLLGQAPLLIPVARKKILVKKGTGKQKRKLAIRYQDTVSSREGGVWLKICSEQLKAYRYRYLVDLRTFLTEPAKKTDSLNTGNEYRLRYTFVLN